MKAQGGQRPVSGTKEGKAEPGTSQTRFKEGDCYNRLAKLGGQAGCREGPHREGQGRALGELGHLSGRCSDREEPRHFGSSRTSAGRKG